MRNHWLVVLTLLLLFLPSVSAQEEQTPDPNAINSLEILDVSIDQFPRVGVAVNVLNADGRAIIDLSDVQITEDGQQIPDFDINIVETGIDLTFVIDANRSIGAIDFENDVPRISKVREAIGRYAGGWLPRDQQNSISILVPNADYTSADYLLQNSNDPTEIRTAIGDFDPPDRPTAVNTQALLETAFSEYANTDSDNFQAIVFFTNAEFLADQVDYFALRDLASQSNVAFYGVILGVASSSEEIANIEELSKPTNGGWNHMPNTTNIDPLFDTLRTNTRRPVLSYTSLANQDGVHNVTLQANGFNDTADYSLNVLPPSVTLTMTDAPIVRSGKARDALTPTQTLVTAQIGWPDGRPRALQNTANAVRFLIDGEATTLMDAPFYSDSGQLSFPIDLTNLTGGGHTFQLKVTDELGLEGASPIFAQEIIFDIAQITVVPTATLAPTATPTNREEIQEIATESISPYLSERNLIIGFSILIGLLLLKLIRDILARRTQDDATPQRAFFRRKPEAQPPAPMRTMIAFLEPLREEDDSPTRLRVSQGETTIGSDPFRAELVVDHETISRLHASIKYETGRYILYDEGSAYGTRINYEQVGLSPKPLIHNDEVEFGALRYRFLLLEEQPEPSETIEIDPSDA